MIRSARRRLRPAPPQILAGLGFALEPDKRRAALRYTRRSRQPSRTDTLAATSEGSKERVQCFRGPKSKPRTLRMRRSRPPPIQPKVSGRSSAGLPGEPGPIPTGRAPALELLQQISFRRFVPLPQHEMFQHPGRSGGGGTSFMIALPLTAECPATNGPSFFVSCALAADPGLSRESTVLPGRRAPASHARFEN